MGEALHMAETPPTPPPPKGPRPAPRAPLLMAPSDPAARTLYCINRAGGRLSQPSAAPAAKPSAGPKKPSALRTLPAAPAAEPKSGEPRASRRSPLRPRGVRPGGGHGNMMAPPQ